MTDRELLEKAAKAAGLRYIKPTEDYSGIFGLTLCDEVGRHMEDWRPLTDDGDALRLAVKLRMTPHIDSNSTECSDCFEVHSGDPYAATRRAIVRAAAALAGD